MQRHELSDSIGPGWLVELLDDLKDLLHLVGRRGHDDAVLDDVVVNARFLASIAASLTGELVQREPHIDRQCMLQRDNAIFKRALGLNVVKFVDQRLDHGERFRSSGYDETIGSFVSDNLRIHFDRRRIVVQFDCLAMRLAARIESQGIAENPYDLLGSRTFQRVGSNDGLITKLWLIEFGNQRLSLSKLNLRGVDDEAVGAHIGGDANALTAAPLELLADYASQFLRIAVFERDDLDDPVARDVRLIQPRQQILEQDQVVRIGRDDQ